MIKELLDEIREAESKADQIKKDAEMQRIAKLEKVAKEIKDKTNQINATIKATQVKNLAQANIEAEKEYNNHIEAVKVECQNMKQALNGKVKDLSDLIFKEVVNGNS